MSSAQTTLIDIATLAPWDAPRRVQTRNDGERNLRKAKAPAKTLLVIGCAVSARPAVIPERGCGPIP